MNLKHISIFHLIEIFRGKKRSEIKPISLEAHCEHEYHHDYYCDAEKPHRDGEILASNS